MHVSRGLGLLHNGKPVTVVDPEPDQQGHVLLEHRGRAYRAAFDPGDPTWVLIETANPDPGLFPAADPPRAWIDPDGYLTVDLPVLLLSGPADPGLDCAMHGCTRSAVIALAAVTHKHACQWSVCTAHAGVLADIEQQYRPPNP